jgi:hypothetical protein
MPEVIVIKSESVSGNTKMRNTAISLDEISCCPAVETIDGKMTGLNPCQR